MLNKQDAQKIRKKLKAKQDKKIKGRPHEMWEVFHNGLVIAQFGIRHGSNNDAGHGHLPAQLHVSPSYCKELAVCTKSRDEYITEMQNQGVIS